MLTAYSDVRERKTMVDALAIEKCRARLRALREDAAERAVLGGEELGLGIRSLIELIVWSLQPKPSELRMLNAAWAHGRAHDPRAALDEIEVTLDALQQRLRTRTHRRRT